MNSIAWLAVLVLAPQEPAPELQVLDALTFDHLLPASEAEAQVGWEAGANSYPVRIDGGVVAVPGVSGAALRFDGLTGHCELRRAHGSAEFTVEAWVALAAYPPAWCTLASQWREDRGWRLDLGSEGQLQFHVASDHGLVTCGWKQPLETGRWTHIVATCNERLVLRVYVDGSQRVATIGVRPARLVLDEPLRIGAPSPYWFAQDSHQPSTAGPAYANPGFGLDGAVDEVRTYRGAMGPEEVRRRFESVAVGDPPISGRHLPDGPTGPGAFGAVACSLPYRADWDALRNEGPAPDVVVRFESTEARFVFWGGLSHEPLWVAQDGLRATLMTADELFLGKGPFLTRPDKADSTVRILANHPARTVVHCRRKISIGPFMEPQSEQWVDDLWTIYPDVCGARRTTPQTGDGWDSMPASLRCVWEPGQVPCDLLETEFLALAGLDGPATVGRFKEFVALAGQESAATVERVKQGHDSRSWTADPSGFAVELLNLKSVARPFLAIKRDSCRIDEPAASALDEVPYESGSLVQSGGKEFRWANGGGVGPFLLPGGATFPQPPNDLNRSVMLFGMRAEGMDKVQRLARSWARPPELVLASPEWRSLGWDRSQRAWRIERVAWSAELAFRIEASEASPMVRPALVVHGWGERAVDLTIDGATAQEGVDYRQGLERQLGPTDLVLWVDRVATSPVDLRITSRS